MNKERKIDKLKDGKSGITLIALVITIIILLILAGISIGMLSSDNGIIKNAGQAKEIAEISKEKELLETYVVQVIKKDRHGNVSLEGLKQQLDNSIATVEEIKGSIVVTVKNTNRKYCVDNEGNISEYIYKELPIMEDGVSFYERMKEYKDNILSVQVLDNMNIPKSDCIVFDISQNEDGTVKAWLVENTENAENYDLYIGGDGGVKIQCCSNMFREFSKCTSINLENLNTEKVEYFNNMFYNDSNLTQINLPENFVTSNAVNLRFMFYVCNKLKSIDTSNWDTSNVTDMFSTFRMCQVIESLDLSKWNTKKVTDMSYLFQYCQKLKTIYVSDKWNNDEVTISENMFQGCSSLIGAISFDSQKIDKQYANYVDGYFTYKAYVQ